MKIKKALIIACVSFAVVSTESFIKELHYYYIKMDSVNAVQNLYF